MSSGGFSRAKYESNSGTIYNARVQPETLALTLGGTVNAVPAGAVNGAGTARSGGGNRQFGVKMRAVTLAWTTTVPDGYKPGELVKVPIMTPALFATLQRGTTGTYLGNPVTVAGLSVERIN